MTPQTFPILDNSKINDNVVHQYLIKALYRRFYQISYLPSTAAYNLVSIKYFENLETAYQWEKFTSTG
jgi:hypothetical protein